jgi:integrase
MSLTDKAVMGAKRGPKARKLQDRDGLYLLVFPLDDNECGKYWRFDFRFAGKRKTLALGTYPAIRLAEARKRCQDAREMLAKEIDPANAKRAAKRAAKVSADNTFKAVALEWLGKRRESLTASYADLVLSRLQGDVFPTLGNRPIGEIEALEFLDVLRAVEDRGVREVARRLRQTCGQIFRYAIATGRAKRDLSADLKGALKSPGRVQHHKSMPREQLPGFLEKLDAYDGERRTALALRLILLTFVRTGELRAARWPEFENLDGLEPLWRIPAERMKMKTEHLVPLSPQAVHVIKELRALPGATATMYLFPSPGADGCMSNNTMLFALYRMGYHGRATVHGFRGLASTVLNEMGFNRDWIERQLAHDERDKVRNAYNSAQYLPGRRTMMRQWADYLESLNSGSSVIPFARA